MTRISRILALLLVFILFPASLAEGAPVEAPGIEDEGAFMATLPIEEEPAEALSGMDYVPFCDSGEEAPANEEGESEPESEPDPEPETEPETEPDPEAEPETEPEQEPEPEPTLEITAEKTALVVGETVLLTVTFTPEDAAAPYVLSSSDEAVAAVDADGLVTALSVGTATITAQAENGLSAAITFTVEPILPTEVALNYTDTQQLIKGRKLQLEATLYPEGATSELTWTSSREDRATVSEQGLVRAISLGKTTITVTTANGKCAKVKIKVVPRPPYRVRLNYSGTKLLAMGKKLRLKATLYPEGAASKLTWTSSREDRATVSRWGLVRAIDVGRTTITVRTANDKKAKVRIKVYDPKAVAKVVAFRDGEEVSGKTIEMVAYDNARFKAKGYNAAGRRLKYEVTWTSSNANVATIDDTGRLITRSAGTAKIRAIMDGRRTSFIVKVLPPPDMITANYKHTEFTIVNTRTNPVIFSELTYDNTVCTRPYYSGRCLSFCYYYVRCMLSGVTEVSPSEGARSGGPRNAASFRTEKYADYRVMMARLYDLLNTGVPQIMMVEAVTHPGSRHFVVVVGYRSSVTGRNDLRPEDLLIIDSHDGRLESMDPTIDPFETRVLFRQEGKYRIEATRRG